MAVQFSNNAATNLSAAISASATSITVADASEFPTLSGSDYTYVTLSNLLETVVEVVKVTAISGNTLTVVRGQDNTTASAFASGDKCELRVTAALLNDVAEQADTNTTYTAGSGISLSGTTFSNAAPDQTVSLTGSGATSVSGTYPNFTISSTDTNTTYTAGTNLSLSGTTFNLNTNLSGLGTISSGAITSSGRGTFDELTLTGSTDNLTFNEASGDWTINNAQQNNGITIYDGTAGVAVNYNGATVAQFDGSGGMNLISGSLRVGGTAVIDSSREGSFATRAQFGGIDSAGNVAPSSNKTIVSGYGLIGNRATMYITNGGGVIQLGNGGIHNGDPGLTVGTGSVNLGSGRSLSMNGTTVIDSSRNLSSIGTIASGAITSTGNMSLSNSNTGNNITISRTDSGTSAIFHVGSSTGYVGTTSNHPFHIRQNDQSVITIGTNQNVNLATGGLEVGGTTVIDSSRNVTANLLTVSDGGVHSDSTFKFLTTANAAQNIRTKSVFAGTSYGDTPPAGSFNATNTYELNGTTVIDSSRNLSNIGTISASGQVTADRFLSGIGSVASPAYKVGDPDSGFYDSGANMIGVALGGVLEYDFQPTKLDMKGNQLDNVGDLQVDVTSSNGVRVTGTDSVADAAFTTMLIDHNASGSDTTTADRAHTGLVVDVDSSATGGGTSHEHRLYGIQSSVKSTGDSDLIYSIYASAEAEQTAGQVTALYGGYFQATGDVTGGTLNNSYGVHALNSVANASGTTISNNYALYGKTLVGAGQDSNVASAVGVYGEVEIDPSGASTTLSSAQVFAAQFDNDSAGDVTINTGYLYYGNYAGTLPSTAYGVYIADAVRNYFGGSLTAGLGSTTTASYGFNGDLNTGMYSPANHEVAFAANGTRRLNINASGAQITGALTTTGDITVSKADAKLRLYDSTGTSGNNPFVEFDTTAEQGVKIELNVYDAELPEAGYGLVVGPSTTNNEWPSTGNLSFNVLGEIYAGSESLGSVNKVWHAGNDGTGSGLDADTVDGVHASQIMIKGSDLGGSVDLNNYTDNGFYHQNANSGATNGSNYPASSAGMLTVKSDGVMVYQTYHQYNGNNYYFRNYYNGTWYGWRKLYHSGTGDLSVSGSLIADNVEIGSKVTLAESTDRADLLQITGTTSSWAGLQIRNSNGEGRWSFMTDSSKAGIYDDENNKWHIYLEENSYTQLRHNGSEKLTTTSTGVSIIGVANPTLGYQVNGTTVIDSSRNLTNIADITSTADNSYLTMGVPGLGGSVGARYLSIEGNSDTGGEASGRIFFSEHNSTTAAMDGYGMSIGYRGGSTSIVGASGNTWTGLSQIGNGQWGMWGHDGDATGALIMYGDRVASFIDMSNNQLRGVEDLTINDKIIHTGDTDTYTQFHAANQWRVVTGGAERLEVNQGTTTVAGTLNVRVAIDLADSDFLRFGSGDDVEFFCNGSHMYMDLNSGIGNFYIRDGTTTRYTFNDNGSFTATGNVTAYSDRRVKAQFEPITDALAKVQQLHGQTYIRTDMDDANRRYAGLIAQDVEAVLPEAVSEVENHLALDYSGTIGLLVEAIKELKQEVNDLRAQLEDK